MINILSGCRAHEDRTWTECATVAHSTFQGVMQTMNDLKGLFQTCAASMMSCVVTIEHLAVEAK